MRGYVPLLKLPWCLMINLSDVLEDRSELRRILEIQWPAIPDILIKLAEYSGTITLINIRKG